MIARVIATRIARFYTAPSASASALAFLEAKEKALAEPTRRRSQRMPYFCSGCPHNTSTRCRKAAARSAGIGCHYMATWMDRSTATFTQMGGEGATWIGQAPFTETKHVFENLGDGTYFHSGLLAIRAAVAAKRQHHLQDPLQRRGRDDRRPAGRRPLDRAADRAAARRRGRAAHRRRHRRAGEVPGGGTSPPGVDRSITATSSTPCSASCARSRACRVLIYDQTCAAEKRRRRKRGKYPRSAEARGHQRAGLRGLRRLQRASRTACRSMPRRDRVRPQARDRPVDLQQGLLLPQGLLPELRHGRGRRAAQARRAPAARDDCRRRLPEPQLPGARSSPTASSSPASAAPAWSRSARCSAWPRTSKARASRCST